MDGREEGGEGYRRGMEERREVREQTRDGREERGEGYRRWMEERREVRDTDEGWKRGRR
jgi:hypothetical protein